MKQDVKTLRILTLVFILLVGLCGMTWWMQGTEKDTEKIAEAPLTATNFAVSDIAGIAIKNANGLFLLTNTKQGMQFSVDGVDTAFEETTLKAAYYSLCHLNVIRAIDAQTVDFETNKIPLLFMTASGDTLPYVVSGTRGPNGEYYLKEEASGTIYFIAQDEGSVFEMDKHTMLSRAILPEISLERFGEVSGWDVENRSNPQESYRVVSKKSESFVCYDMVAPFPARLDWRTALEQVIAPITELYTEQVVSTTGEFADYGLDDPQYILGFHYAGERIELLAQTKGENAYVALSGSDTIYRVSKEKLAFLTVSYQKLLNGTMYAAYPELLDRIELSHGSEKQVYLVSKQGDTVTVMVGETQYTTTDPTFPFAGLFEIPFYSESNATAEITGELLLQIQYDYKDGTRDTLLFYADSEPGAVAVTYNGVRTCSTSRTAVEQLRTLFS